MQTVVNILQLVLLTRRKSVEDNVGLFMASSYFKYAFFKSYQSLKYKAMLCYILNNHSANVWLVQYRNPTLLGSNRYVFLSDRGRGDRVK